MVSTAEDTEATYNGGDSHPNLPTDDDIRSDVQSVFGVRPCLGQIRAAQAQLQRSTDVVYISGTGSGKTLTFWIPMLYEQNSVTLLVTPLNVLGKQTAAILVAAGITAINITRDNCNANTINDIAAGKYRLVVVGPELLTRGHLFDPVWWSKKFLDNTKRIIFDEAHCISQWGGSFRPEFAHLHRLRFIIPTHILFYVVSATLPKPILLDVRHKLQIKPDALIIRRSNDRWNCSLIVRRIRHSVRSFQDLDFLIPHGWHAGQPFPNKWLVFFNSRKEAEHAAEYFWAKFGIGLKECMVWFHSIMTDEYREVQFEKFAAGMEGSANTLCGFMCTDAAGMGLDISNITLIIQWRVPQSLCCLMQRFGRGARDLALRAFCVLFAEPCHFSEVKAQRESRRAVRLAKEQARKDNPIESPATRACEPEGSQSAAARASASLEALLPPLPPLPSLSTARGTKAKKPTRTARRRGKFVQPKTMEERDIEQVMDDFVNADELPHKCRRRVTDAHFGNDTLEPEPACCDRCRPREPEQCCDLCNPELHDLFDSNDNDIVSSADEGTDEEAALGEDEIRPTPTVQKRMRRPNKKQYEPCGRDFKLRRELQAWRGRVYADYWVQSDPYGLGHSLVMSDEVLQEIIDRNHQGHFKNVTDICEITRWRDRLGLADEVFAICGACLPLPPTPLFTRTPRAHTAPMSGIGSPVPSDNSPAGNSPVLPSGVMRRPARCSRCRRTGHTSRSKECPGLPLLPTGIAARSFSGLDIHNVESIGGGNNPISFSLSDCGPLIE